MQGAQDTLIDVMARTLSPGRRILLVQTSFDLLTTLAVLDVRELVHLSPEADPDAPSSQAPNGARLHLRPDWKERPRSKDLIVDPLGLAPPEQVERILKKNGLYLTRTANTLTESLGETQTVSTEWLGLLLANEKPKNNRLPTAWADTPRRSGPSVVLASRHPFDLPTLYTSMALPPADEFSKFEEQLVAAAARDEKLTTEKDAIAKKLNAKTEELEEQTRILESAIAEGKTHSERATELEIKLKNSADTLAQVQSQLSELEGEYEAVRVELANRRVAENRNTRVADRIAQVRDELTAEVHQLRSRLIELDGPAHDVSSLKEERDLYRSALRASVSRFVELIGPLFGQAQLPKPPAPGVTPDQRAALNAWFETIERQARIVVVGIDEREGLVRSLRSRLAAMSRRIRVLEASAEILAKPARQARVTLKIPAISKNDLKTQIEALEKALEGERALRMASEKRADDIVSVAQTAVAQRDEVIGQLDALRGATRSDIIQRIATEENVARLETEIAERDARLKELEAMLSTHDQLQVLMANVVQAAEEARDDADNARRLADENLRIMRAEFERLN